MSQDIRLYGAAEIWDQPLQLGQRNLLQAIRDFLPANTRSVLDVGCGDGKLSSQLYLTEAFTVVGLDSSAEALARLPFPGVLADATSLPFSSGAFDLLMSTDALEHMPDDEEAAAWSELFRVAAKTVMVAVPFRENLLDASARCSQCDHQYHVNWHQRSYDMADLWERAPEGWSVRATVLTGEPWSAMLPPETLLRRTAINEWAGWELAICPSCGAAGHAVHGPEPLPSLLAMSLADQLYFELAKQRYCRSHSEILVIFQRDEFASEITAPQVAMQRRQSAACVNFDQQPAVNLHPFSQVAQYLNTADGDRRIQFPLYEAAPTLEVCRRPGTQGDLHLMLEDAAGLLFDGCVLANGVERQTHTLARQPVAGYYGVLASCSTEEPFASICLGKGPSIEWLQNPSSEHVAYRQLQQVAHPLFIQVIESLWFDPAAVAVGRQQVRPEPGQVMKGLQKCFERMLAVLVQHKVESFIDEDRTSEINQLQVQIQNLSGERDVLLRFVKEADGLAVDKQNLIAERDALLRRAKEADQLEVDKQNLIAERDALLNRAKEADVLAVDKQNLIAERDALLERAKEADRLAVEKQNLIAERDVLLLQSQKLEAKTVHLENLEADIVVLRARVIKADRLTADKNNLSAECDSLRHKTHLLEAQVLQLQHLESEIEALRARAEAAEMLEVDNRSLVIERDSLTEQIMLADDIRVQLIRQQQEQEVLCQQMRLRLGEVEQALHDLQNQESLLQAEKRLIEEELHEYKKQLEIISHHIENRLGAATRRLLKGLVKDK